MKGESSASFLKGLSYLTGLPLKKIERYAKENNVFNILEHPQTVEPNNDQLKKISLLNEFISSYQLLKINEADNRIKLDSSTKAGQYFLSLMGGMKDKERFFVAFLDNGHNIIETRKLSEGSQNQSVVYPRDLLKAAIASDCTGMILAHNHPANSLNPSSEDRMLTQRIVNIFHPLDIKVVDHIIIGGNSFCSMAEKGYMPENVSAQASYELIKLSQEDVAKEIRESIEEEEELEI